MHLVGTSSDNLPKVLGTGHDTGNFAYISLSAREPDGRDAEYIEWHSLDHRPEQHRLPQLRQSLRVVSTPECRNVRAISTPAYNAVDHVMTYLFSGYASMPDFIVLGHALGDAGRMPLRLPLVSYLTADLAGKVAATRAVAGAEVIPFRPALGIYLIIEQGHAPAADLADITGVAGVWWYHTGVAPAPYNDDFTGLQVTYCYLDADPVLVAAQLGEAVKARWESGEVQGLLAAPFYSIVPFEWTRYLPSGN